MKHIATRGSALALAQANIVKELCERTGEKFALSIIKTTGDKIQTAPFSNQYRELPKGLFTKEIEEALLKKEAALAVHSLKDLPTELPEGLILGAVLKREDVRDVLIYRKSGGPLRGFEAGQLLKDLPAGCTIGTSSTRRQAAVTTANPGLKALPIRGNVGTRIQKLLEKEEYDATLLAAAGLHRLGYSIKPNGAFISPNGEVENVWARYLELDEILPCVGQAAIGIECREDDSDTLQMLQSINHQDTMHCVKAERAFLRAMGGGCQSPLAAYATLHEGQIYMSVVSYRENKVTRAAGSSAPGNEEELGKSLAKQVLT